MYKRYLSSSQEWIIMNENNVVKCIVEPKNAVTHVANEVDGFQHDGLCFSFLVADSEIVFHN